MNHLTPLRLLLLQTLQDRIVNNPTFDLELRTQKKELLFHGNNSNSDSDQDYSFLDGVLGVDFFGAYLSYFNIAKKKVRENTRENRSLMEGLYPKGGFHCLVRILLKKTISRTSRHWVFYLLAKDETPVRKQNNCVIQGYIES